MATGGDFVRGALRKLGVRNSESPIESFEMQDGVEVFNDMMSELEPVLKLGFSPIANEAATVRVPRGTHDALKYQLALRLAPDYSKPITPELAAGASGSMENLLNNNVFIGDVKFPDSLPIGSGNGCPEYEDQRFFPENEAENF
jgi:hypothetical protein